MQAMLAGIQKKKYISKVSTALVIDFKRSSGLSPFVVTCELSCNNYIIILLCKYHLTSCNFPFETDAWFHLNAGMFSSYVTEIIKNAWKSAYLMSHLSSDNFVFT